MQVKENLLIDLMAGLSIGFMVVPQGKIENLLDSVLLHPPVDVHDASCTQSGRS